MSPAPAGGSPAERWAELGRAHGVELTSEGRLVRRMRLERYGITVAPPSATDLAKKKPYHRITWTQDGRQHSLGGGRTFADVEARLAPLVRLLDSGAGRDAKRPVAELVEAYLAPTWPRREPWSYKHGAVQSSLLTRFLLPVAGAVPCHELTEAHLQAAVNRAPTAGEGARTVRALSALVRDAFRRSWLTTAPEQLLRNLAWVAGSRVDHRASRPVADHTVTPEEVPDHQAVADLAWHLRHAGDGPGRHERPWWYELWVYLAAYTGMREGETYALTAGAVNPAGRQLAVNWQTQRQLHDGVWSTKWLRPKYGSVRAVPLLRLPPTTRYPDGYPLGDELARRLRELEGQGPPDGAPAGVTTALVFPRRGGGVWEATNHRRLWAPATLDAGWPREMHSHVPRWTWHSLRHTYCTWMLNDLGKAPSDVRVATGHKSVKILLDTYVGTSRGAMERLLAD